MISNVLVWKSVSLSYQLDLWIYRARSWSLTLVDEVVRGAVAGRAVPEYPDQRELEDGQDPIQIQAVRRSFGFHRCSRQNR
jgi:hypothetical protein